MACIWDLVCMKCIWGLVFKALYGTDCAWRVYGTYCVRVVYGAYFDSFPEVNTSFSWTFPTMYLRNINETCSCSGLYLILCTWNTVKVLKV